MWQWEGRTKEAGCNEIADEEVGVDVDGEEERGKKVRTG
jgi:ribosome-associated protein YbcJ (S4-like RNA binding protein)